MRNPLSFFRSSPSTPPALRQPERGYSKLANIIRNAFPNLDPDFFKSPLVLSRQADVIADPYANNVWVYAACSAIASNIVQLPKILDDIRTEENEAITEHPLLSLMENPNPLMSGPVFWEAIVLNLLLPTKTTKGGQAFLVAESGKSRPTNLQRGEIPDEIYVLSDELFKPVINKKDNVLEGWVYTPPDSAVGIVYDLSEVIRIHLYDPSNPTRGQSPIWAARTGIRQDAKAGQLNENFFDNNASLGGVLQSDAELEPEEAKEIVNEFQARYSGTENAGRLALLHSGVKYEMFRQTHHDMQFIDQRKWTREEILAAYRVPKSELSLYEDINLATAQAADKNFWTKTLIPLDKRITFSINNQWVQHINDGALRLKSDLSRVEALQVSFEEKLKQAEQLAKLNVPLSEINRRLELELNLEDIPWADTVFVNFNQVTAHDVMVQENEEEPPAEDPSSSPPEDGQDAIDQLIAEMDKAAKQQKQDEKFHTSYLSKIIDPDVRRMTKLLKKYFFVQRNQVLDLIDKWANNNTKAKLDDETEINPEMFKVDFRKENFRLRKLLKPEYEKQIQNEAEQMERELGELINWDEKSDSVDKFLRQRLKTISSINTTTFKFARTQIKDVITESINERLTVPQTARRLKEEIRKVYDGRINAKTIARTETGSIHSSTRHDVMKTEGVKWKEWLTAQDDIVRDSPFSHEKLNNKRIRFNEKFNNGEELRFPQDPKGSASNVINCRCVIVARRNKK